MDVANAGSERKRMAVMHLQRALGRMQEIGDQKLALVAEIIELIESKGRHLELNVDNLGSFQVFVFVLFQTI